MNPTESSPEYTPTIALPATLATLIEGAVATFEIDPSAARDYIFRASALVRQRPKSSGSGAVTVSRLAPWKTKRLLAYIEANLSASIQARDLAALANLSVSHLLRAFKASVGMTPHEYISRRRVERACELMVRSSASLAQVARDCGLGDQSSFCRTFRRQMGQSPSRWRRDRETGLI